MKNRLVITLVLYKEAIKDIPSYGSLCTFLTKEKAGYLLVYDNSPLPQEDELFSFERVHYIHNPKNLGLAVAYNTGIDFLNEVNAKLLLLLDQDTTFSVQYLERLMTLQVTEQIGAFVPIVESKGRQISPLFADVYVGRTAQPAKAGIYEKRIMGINSGTVVPAPMLKLMEQFNTEFPLDFLDHWFFWFLFQNGKKVQVLDSVLQQELSVLDYQTMNVTRYQSIVSAETKFYQKYETEKLSRHKKQLVFRLLKQFCSIKKRKIWKATCRELYHLLRGN